jgi:hypothetical protein
VSLAANVPGFFGQAVADGLQATVNGGSSVQNFLVRK